MSQFPFLYDGRKIVGHYRYSISPGSIGNVGTTFFHSLRNPTSSGRQLHVIELSQSATLNDAFTNAALVNLMWRGASMPAACTGANAFAAIGATAGEVQVLGGDGSPVVEGRYGGAISLGAGGAFKTHGLNRLAFAQPAAEASTLVPTAFTGVWRPRSLLLIPEGAGLLWGNEGTLAAGGTIFPTVCCEWYESIAQ